MQNRRDTWLDEMMHTDDELNLIIAAENKRKSTAGLLVVQWQMRGSKVEISLDRLVSIGTGHATEIHASDARW